MIDPDDAYNWPPKACTCMHPPYNPPCSYCEGGFGNEEDDFDDSPVDIQREETDIERFDRVMREICR